VQEATYLVCAAEPRFYETRIVYSAPQPATAPAGWKLVPTEPTPLMSSAGFAVSEAEHDPAQVYRAMIEAAPQPTAPSTAAHAPGCGDGEDCNACDAMNTAAPQPASEAIEEGCTPEDAKMLRAANHGLADENAMLRRRLSPFAALANPRLSWAMVEYCIDGDPEKQTLQAPQMQRAFNRAADALAEELPSHEPVDCEALDLPDWVKSAKPPAPDQPASEQHDTAQLAGELWRAAAEKELLELANFAGSRLTGPFQSGFLQCVEEIATRLHLSEGLRNFSTGDASEQQAASAVSDAAILACAFVINGICLTRPQDTWLKAIEGRIRYMLAAKGDGHAD
jgi:hypothetical protein